MLDTIKIGLLRLDTKKEKAGFVRVIPKSEPDSQGISYLRIPLHVVFDLEGYNSYKEYLRQEDPEMKTWIGDILLTIPPTPENVINYPNAGHEWFLANLRELVGKYPNFPEKLKGSVDNAVEEVLRAKKSPPPPFYQEEDDYEPPPMNKAEQVAACHAVMIYSTLLRTRFDAANSKELLIPLFCRGKTDKTAKDVIEEVITAVSQYVWKNPKVSKYSETEGFGLKVKLSSLCLQAFYKEQIRFMQAKLSGSQAKA